MKYFDPGYETLILSILHLGAFGCDPTPEEDCEIISEIISDDPDILDKLIARFDSNQLGNDFDDEMDELFAEESHKEVLARVLSFFSNYEPAKQYIQSLEQPIHYDLSNFFKWVKPYKTTRVPESEVIQL